MVVTNELHLPEAMVQAVDIAPHNREGEISATTLKKGVREILLEKRHWDELTDDVANRIWAIFGTAVHALLERETPDSFTEEKFSYVVGSYNVTGRVDNYNMRTETIEDYKTASTWKVIYRDFKDWHSQGLIYAWLLRKAGLNVKKCRFIAMLKDHSKTKAKTDSSYPQSPVYIYEFAITEEELKETEKFVYEKVKLLEECANLPDEELPLCIEEERWTKPTVYAVMRKGRKTSLRNFEDKSKAEEFVAEYLKSNPKEVVNIEERKGADGKCSEYCGCCEFCSYYKENYMGGVSNGEEEK